MTGEVQATPTPDPAPTEQEEKVPAWAKQLTEGINALVQLARESRQTPQPQPAPDEEEEEEIDPGDPDPLEDDNLEILPRKDFARRLEQRFESLTERALKPLADELNNTRQAIQTDQYTREAVAFAEKTADFGEWKDEMMGIAKENPNLSIARIYALARAENPTKAVAIDKKLREEKTAAETAKQAKEQKKRPLAIAPTGPASGTVKNTRMSPQDAAEAAWEETMEKFGGSPFAA